jgi:predicted permease
VLTGVGTAITMGLAIGLWPAWGASRTRVAETLLPGRSVVRSFSRPARKALIAQIALSMVLLGAAGLFVIMLSNLRRNDATFRGRDVVWTRLATLPGQRLTLHGPDYLRALYDRLSAVPGAEGVALNVFFPAYVGFRAGIPYDQFADAHAAEPTPISGLTELVSPGFFRFFGIAQAAGRDFTWDDDHDAPKVAVVSRSLAQRVFGGDALGRRLTVQSGSAVTVVEIVGIAADAPIGSIRQPDLPVVYRPMLQEPARAQFPLAHLAHRGDRRAAREAYTAAVESLGRHYVSGLFTLEQWLDNATLQERLMTTVALFSALLALLLATLGVYASLAYAVASSTREIGVRMALGASRKAVLWMSVRDGLAVVVPGVVIGILCTAGAATVVRAQLYGVSPTDPAALAIAALIFLVTGVVAALVPGLRASRTDPMAALRHE